MSLNLISQQIEYEESKQNQTFPDWVSNSNSSISAFLYVEKLKIQRLEYINSHRKATDYKKKKQYQITASEVAKHINIASSTLTHTSGYSASFKAYLEDINQMLVTIMEQKLAKHKHVLSEGKAKKPKNDLIVENQELRDKLAKLQEKNAEEQWFNRVKQLSPHVKQVLGLND